MADAEQLWLGGGTTASPGEPASTLSVALRRGGRGWPPLDRLQRQQVPDRMVLDADELADLLEHGLEALDRRSASTSSGRADCAGS